MKYLFFSLPVMLTLLSCASFKKDRGNCGGELRSDTKREKFLNALVFDLYIDSRLDSIALEEQKFINLKRRAEAELEEKRYVDSIIALRKQRGDTSLLIIHPRPVEVYEFVNINPHFKGGSDAFEEFVRSQMFVCAFFLKIKPGIISETKFTLDKSGRVMLVASKGGQRQDFDREIETVLKKSSGLWLPARIGEVLKNSEMTLKVRLKKW